MSTTTEAVARKCPKCNQEGELDQELPTAKRGWVGKIYKCENKLCLWYDTTWLVTVDPDGKVPVRDIGHEKKFFPKIKGVTSEQVRRALERELQDEDEGEVRL